MYRPALARRLATVPAGGLALVVAGAGSGKTTLLTQRAEAVPCAWHTCTPADRSPPRLARGVVDALRLRVPGLPPTLVPSTEGGAGPHGTPDGGLQPGTYAAALAGELDARLTADLMLVVDDVHELGDGAAVALLDALAHAGAQHLALVLAGRAAPPFPVERLRAQGRLLELRGADLALSLEEVEVLLVEVLGDDAAASLAPALHDATGGWPAAVGMAAGHLHRVAPGDREAALAGVLAAEGPLLSALATGALEREPPEVRRLLRWLTPLRQFPPALAAALPEPDGPALLDDLARRGLLVLPAAGGRGDLRLQPVVREVLRARDPLPGPQTALVLHAAARWLAAHDRVADALPMLAQAGDGAAVAAQLESAGPSLVAGGAARTVLAVADVVPVGDRSPALEQLLAEAHQVCGEWDAALAGYERIAGERPLPAGLAWRLGSLHQARGQLHAALAVYRRAVDVGETTADDALLAAWTATACWRQGDVAACEQATRRALAAAGRSGDAAALATAHTATAMLAALRGDHAANDHHYLAALDAATRAGDVLQLIRIRTNRSSYFLDEGAYADALAEATLAVTLGDGAGVHTFRDMALVNRGEAALALGRIEEAVADLEEARALCQRSGSNDVAYALLRLGDVHRVRGDHTLATAGYEEAAARAETVDDRQALVPALAGLAHVLLADDAPRAAAAAQRAVDLGPGMGHVGALLALGAVCLAGGDAAAAEELATTALAEARHRRDRPGMAEALELRAAARPDAPRAGAWLEEAAAIWRALGSPLGQARVQLAQARRAGGTEGRLLAEEAAVTLRRIGARGPATAAARLAAGTDAGPGEVAITALGDFRVLRRGAPVPLAAWQSRKARDLLKMLVARRGRPASRAALMAALWPDEDPDRLGNRLSVQLSIVRGVLDPDRRHPQERYVRTDDSGVALERGAVDVDVEAFMTTAEAGLARLRDDEPGVAGVLLARAEAAYTGDFLEEDADAAWAAPLRDQARAVYVDVARALAGLRAASGELDGAARLYRRVLERDGYDEPAHLALVRVLRRAGRLGEARRCHAAYAAAMAELGVEASPFPAVRA